MYCLQLMRQLDFFKTFSGRYSVELMHSIVAIQVDDHSTLT